MKDLETELNYGKGGLIDSRGEKKPFGDGDQKEDQKKSLVIEWEASRHGAFEKEPDFDFNASMLYMYKNHSYRVGW